ncbi:MAG: efflux RND transporter periplasmic adaptor subunit [Prevotellaceae bacterium]|jgi:HlyD family secretion protein|nr:efflux RND transporter periplasmic adaptor subunit [Prevotellaceae bacterium]
MKRLTFIEIGVFLTLVLALAACRGNKFEHDASGTFEATEVIVAAETSGKIEELNLLEGSVLRKGECVGYIDSVQLYLEKLQLLQARKTVEARKPDVNLQIAATRSQIEKARLEKGRVESLFKDGAATQKQRDDAESALQVLEGTLNAQINSLRISVNSLSEESSTFDIRIAQIDDRLSKCRIMNPIDGTVLSKYAEASEVAVPGKPLYKIADTKNLFLRAYIVASQLDKIKIGQSVSVSIALSEGKEQKYSGTVSWISDKAEFTPKTIQTRDERQNLVYAVKVSVINTDGVIKIGMYGEMDLI